MTVYLVCVFDEESVLESIYAFDSEFKAYERKTFIEENCGRGLFVAVEEREVN